VKLAASVGDAFKRTIDGDRSCSLALVTVVGPNDQ